MKVIATIAILTCLILLPGCQTETDVFSNPANLTSTTSVVDQVVEASCGQCQFEMEGGGCDLAVRVDGKSYYVDGSSLDDHGDAHGADGLCNCIRQARVTGEISEGRFVAKGFSVLPNEKQP